MKKIIHIIGCVFLFVVVMLAGMYVVVWPWIPVSEAGFPTAGVVMAGLYDVGLFAFMIDQSW